jgi:hypothetical protein
MENKSGKKQMASHLVRIEIQIINKNFDINEICVGKSKIESIVLALLKLRRLRDNGFELAEIGFF